MHGSSKKAAEMKRSKRPSVFVLFTIKWVMFWVKGNAREPPLNSLWMRLETAGRI